MEPSWLEGSQYSIRIDPTRDVTTGGLVQNLCDFLGEPWPPDTPGGAGQVWRVVKHIYSVPKFAPYLEIYIRR
jgi:hypothetical protein